MCGETAGTGMAKRVTLFPLPDSSELSRKSSDIFGNVRVILGKSWKLAGIAFSHSQNPAKVFQPSFHSDRPFISL